MKTNLNTKSEPTLVNNLDVDAISNAIQEVSRDPSKGLTRWMVSTHWKGGAQSETQVDAYEIGGKRVKKNFQIRTDEPLELFGANQYPNPQEVLMAALNACMTVGYVALSSLEGIELEEVRIEADGEIDLRGFFALDPNIKPGYDQINYTVHIKGNGSPEQFQKIHERVIATSPNRFNIANPIKLNSTLVVE